MSDQFFNVVRDRMLANEFLFCAVAIRVMQLDPEFARDARQWFDTVFGAISASKPADATDPQVISAMREEYLRQLTMAERLACIAPERSRPKSIRRRIFELFERG